MSSPPQARVSARSLPVTVVRLDLLTGEHSIVKEFMPADAAGMRELSVRFGGDGSLVYGNERALSHLFMVKGVR